MNTDDIVKLLIITAIVLISIALLILILSFLANSLIKKNKKSILTKYFEIASNCIADGNMLIDGFGRFYSAIDALGLNKEYRCSSSIVSGASNNKLKYVLKYSDVEKNTDSLDYLDYALYYEKVLYGFRDNMKDLGKKTLKELPIILRPFANKKKAPYWVTKTDYKLSKIAIPTFSFLYISPAGKSEKHCDVPVDIKLLSGLRDEINNTLSKKGHAKTQRSSMSNDLREAVKRRDNYTCCICGNSVYKEPNLLLEVDHIIPISKGGLTQVDNLQTLCWRCNRQKGNKL